MGKQTNTFKGFDDWIHIFSVGTHTDSAGNTRFWSRKDLQSIIDNHDTKHPAPLVIGHPKSDDPRYGDAVKYKIIENDLYFKGVATVPEFESMVLKKQFPERSMAVDPDGKGGYKMRHIGFLGAVPPALELQPMAYQHEAPPEYEFVSEFAMDSYTPTVLARLLRRMREFVIENFGIKAADKLVPDYELDTITEHANDIRNQPEPDTNFNQSTTGETLMSGEDKKTFTQADIDAAIKQAEDNKTSEFQKTNDDLNKQLDGERRQRLSSEFQSVIDKAIDEGRLTPAQTEGAIDFALSLPEGEDHQFEFLRGDNKKETVKQAPLQWFEQFIGSLGKQIDIGGETEPYDGTQPSNSFEAPNGATVSGENLVLHDKALAYQKDHPNVAYIDAVQAVGGH